MSPSVHLFQYGRSTNILLAMNVIIGWIFHGNLFYIPLYFQNVRGWTPTMAGSLILPLVIAHGLTSGLTGPLVSSFGRYTPIISTGAGLWAIGAAAKTFYGNNTPFWIVTLFGVFEGIGVGCSLQPGKSCSNQTGELRLIAMIYDHSPRRSFGWDSKR